MTRISLGNHPTLAHLSIRADDEGLIFERGSFAASVPLPFDQVTLPELPDIPRQSDAGLFLIPAALRVFTSGANPTLELCADVQSILGEDLKSPLRIVYDQATLLLTPAGKQIEAKISGTSLLAFELTVPRDSLATTVLENEFISVGFKPSESSPQALVEVMASDKSWNRRFPIPIPLDAHHGDDVPPISLEESLGSIGIKIAPGFDDALTSLLGRSIPLGKPERIGDVMVGFNTHQDQTTEPPHGLFLKLTSEKLSAARLDFAKKTARELSWSMVVFEDARENGGLAIFLSAPAEHPWRFKIP